MTTNVAVVHHSMKRGGGSEQVVYDLLHRLDKNEFRPLLICMFGLGELGRQLKAEGCQTYEHVVHKSYDLRNAFRIAAILQQERVAVLYVTDGFHNMILARMAAFIAGTPHTVLGFHSYDTVLRQSAPKGRRLLLELSDRVFYPGFNHYIALAESHKEYLATVKRLDSAKISVVHNGIDLAPFDRELTVAEARRRFRIPADQPVVGIVAGLRKWKAHDMFLRAAVRVKERVPNTLFLLAGDGPRRAYLERLTADLGLSEHVRFLGVVSEVPTLLQAIDVSVLSSVHEAFPLTLLEAMAARRPVVATNVGSVADIVDDGANGFLVPLGAVEPFADAVVRLLQDPELATQLGQAGRNKVESMFTVDHMVSRTESLFRKWVSNSQGQVNVDLVEAGNRGHSLRSMT